MRTRSPCRCPISSSLQRSLLRLGDDRLLREELFDGMENLLLNRSSGGVPALDDDDVGVPADEVRAVSDGY